MASLNIVNVTVTQTVASAPSTLQQTGALISGGGTTLTQGSYALLTQLSDLTPLLKAPLTLSSMTWSSGTVTATASAAHGVTNGTSFTTTISGATPAAYNGTYIATATSTTAFTFALVTNPGTVTAPGTYTPPGVAQILSMATTFFAQGANVPVYVLEMSAPATPATQIGNLQTFITASPGVFYAYLVPREWDAQAATWTAFLLNYEGTTAKAYFFATSTTTSYSQYTAQMKCVFWLVPAAGAPTTEFSCAAPFWSFLSSNPSAINQVAPFSYRYVYGVTPWNRAGNGPTINAILAANGNVILTGAEGGISNTCLYRGTTSDGNNLLYWYAVDWMQIQGEQALSAAVINGSNNPQNPLYYNQNGINTLAAVARQVGQSAMAFGLAQSVTITATSFSTYTTQKPNDYAAGIYNGIAVQMVPAMGFDTIGFNLNVSEFAAG